MLKIISKITDLIIWYSTLTLVTVTPLIFTTQNTELFEVPKMIFVYLLTSVILSANIFKFISSGKIIFPKNLPTFAFIIFLVSQTLSTIFSTDHFTSIFGYPTRLNGGLLSLFAYFVLFVSVQINITLEKAKILLIAAVTSASVVAVWGIPSRFNLDPSCYVLIHKLTSACWQKEFNPTLRIFSTLGQPNWLASYLILIIPISLVLALNYKNPKPRTFFLAVSALTTLAFIFTNSRSGLLGLMVAIILLAIFLGKATILKRKNILLPTAALIIILFLIAGKSLLTRFTETLKNPQNSPTDSASIRLIVWRGAFEIAKHYPVFGTGPETFAYSYYKYRPLAHNNTTEWNFFYNKAHNEFLNYLANTGVLGLGAYLFLMSTLIYSLIKKPSSTPAISKAIVAGILGCQVSIFFGFSVVITQLLTFLLASAGLAFSSDESAYKFKLNFPNQSIQYITVAAFLIPCLLIVSVPIRIYFADVFESRAKAATTLSEKFTSYNNAISIFPGINPFDLSSYAFDLISNDPEDFTQKAINEADSALKTAPNNVLIAREVAQTYTQVADNEKYAKRAREIGQILINQAPTDPQPYLLAAKIDIVENKKEEAIANINHALLLKKDYVEAQQLLEQLTRADYNKMDSAPPTDGNP